ncbi:rRNA bioproteinsis protein rrp36 [Sporothrix bragantina]|uniref:rRNA biogenesis protein RRP36 n=1 Tax=Sporothrix bragantina TaxID=671064 RepID=A0ABP0BE91_9PEZI
MDSRKRKLSRPAPDNRVRSKQPRVLESYSSDEESDSGKRKAGRVVPNDDEDEESDSGSDQSEVEIRRPMNDEYDEDEEEEEEEEEDDEGELEPSPEPEPPSPTENLTFGQILKKQAKKNKGKKNATAAEKPGSKGKDTGEDPVSWKDDRSGKSSKPAKPTRAHKHAPTEMSSRFAVKRGRDWTSGDATIAGVSVKSSEARSRDPRFFLASMAEQPSRADELRAQRNYAFLDEYRDSEMAQMREDIQQHERLAKVERKKRGGNAVNLAKAEAAEREAAALRRTLTSMEARKKDREARDKAQAVLDEHKKRERDLVRDGKMPYFLKKSEQKKRLLVDKFAGMTDQQVDKAIERRRKKAQTRERREMPMPRRG